MYIYIYIYGKYILTYSVSYLCSQRRPISSLVWLLINGLVVKIGSLFPLRPIRESARTVPNIMHRYYLITSQQQACRTFRGISPLGEQWIR